MDKKTLTSSELRIVRGNAFNIKIQVEAIRLDGTEVENFNLSEAAPQLNVWHAGEKAEKAFVIDGNAAVISFDGTDSLGWYGLEMTGTFDGAAWRFAVTQVFQLVETNEKANVPAWTFLTDDTYFVEGVLTLYANGATHQADWDETNPTSPSYIKNKPAVVSPTQLQQAVNAEKNRAEAAEQANAAAIAEKYTKPLGGIPSTDMTNAVQTSLQKAENAAPQATTYTKEQVDAMIADFITRSVNDLMNYYLKSETYTKAEVQQLIDTVKQFTYEVVNTLPTASADTMHKIYLVPSTNPQTQNVKDEYITILDGSAYKWEQIGSTTVDLSGYYTSAQTDQAISNALTSTLSNYSTTTQMNTAITTALNNALANYSTTSQMNAAIATAIAPYYTKTEIDTLLGNKADIDGNYPQLVAGNVVGTVSQEAQFLSRNTAEGLPSSDEYKVNQGARLQSVKGNSVAWGQHIQYGNTTYYDFGSYYGSKSVNNNICTYTLNEQAHASSRLEYIANKDWLIRGHKYYLSAMINPVKDTTVNFYITSLGQPTRVLANTWNRVSQVLDVNAQTSIEFGFYVNINRELQEGDTCQIKEIFVIDLTLMFGAGNEPATPEAFEVWLQANVGLQPYYAYNAGELLSAQMLGMKTVGSNQLAEHTYSLDTSKVYGKLGGTGELVQIFPNGLRGVGDMQDVIDFTKGEADIRSRDIDLTDVTWTYQEYSAGSNENYFKATTPEGAALTPNVKTIICPAYPTYPNINYGSSIRVDKVIALLTVENRLCIKDFSRNGSSLVDGKAPWLSGVHIIYELATPLHYTDLVYRDNGVDIPLQELNLYFAEDADGTEQVLVTSPVDGNPTSVSPIITLLYGMNATEILKTLPGNYVMATMQQQFTQQQQQRARENIGAQGPTDVLALIRANEDALLTALKTVGTISDYTLDAEADANGVFPVTVS